MAQVPVRSIRLQKRSTQSLDTLSGASGEIFFDEANATLRLYTANQSGSSVLATRQWVTANTFSGDYADLQGTPTLDWANVQNKPTIPADLSDLGIADGTVGQVLTTDGNGVFTFETVDAGEAYDQSLNTTDDVEFASVSAASFSNTSTGNPTIDSASTFDIIAPDGVTVSDDLTVGGNVEATSVSLAETLTLPPQASAPIGATNGMIAVADGTGWDPAASGTQTLVCYLGGAWVTVVSA